jgi:hypothetical protein
MAMVNGQDMSYLGRTARKSFSTVSCKNARPSLWLLTIPLLGGGIYYFYWNDIKPYVKTLRSYLAHIFTLWGWGDDLSQFGNQGVGAQHGQQPNLLYPCMQQLEEARTCNANLPTTSQRGDSGNIPEPLLHFLWPQWPYLPQTIPPTVPNLQDYEGRSQSFSNNFPNGLPPYSPEYISPSAPFPDHLIQNQWKITQLKCSEFAIADITFDENIPEGPFPCNETGVMKVGGKASRKYNLPGLCDVVVCYFAKVNIHNFGSRPSKILNIVAREYGIVTCCGTSAFNIQRLNCTAHDFAKIKAEKIQTSAFVGKAYKYSEITTCPLDSLEAKTSHHGKIISYTPQDKLQRLTYGRKDNVVFKE